jgi:hypothetical protein
VYTSLFRCERIETQISKASVVMDDLSAWNLCQWAFMQKNKIKL